VFNLLGIIGVAGLVGTITVPEVMLQRDLWVMAGVSVLLVPFIMGRFNIGRGVGALFLLAYAGYSAALVAL
jgi:cation:H+ antiporter